MRILRIAAALIAVYALGSCAPSINVHSDYDPETDFSGLKTYDWLPDKRNFGETYPLVDKRVRKSVEDELAAKGFIKDSSNDPDFRIRYDAAVESKMKIQKVDDFYAYPSGSWHYEYRSLNPFGSYARAYDWEEGTLILDVVNPDNKYLIWRGTAQARLNRDNPPKDSEKMIRDAVKKILDQFPPKKEGRK